MVSVHCSRTFYEGRVPCYLIIQEDPNRNLPNLCVCSHQDQRFYCPSMVLGAWCPSWLRLDSAHTAEHRCVPTYLGTYVR